MDFTLYKFYIKKKIKIYIIMKFPFLNCLFSLLLTSQNLVISKSFSLNRRTPVVKRIDKQIYKLTKPAVLNHVMVPIVGLVDSLWVSKIGNSNMLAGQGCGDQVFSIIYYIFSFLPTVLAPEISKLHVQEENEKISELVNISIILSFVIGILLSSFMLKYSDIIIRLLLNDKANIRLYAMEYLRYRIVIFPFVFINSVIFSILRGMMDFKKAILINFQSQLINVIIDPLLMKQYGLKGVAIGSNIADIYCSLNYIKLIRKKKLIYPPFGILKSLSNGKSSIYNLVSKGFFVQIKNICNNLVFLFINNKVIKIDNDGSITAAHILSSKLYDVGNIIFHGLSSVSSIIIPSEKVWKNDKITKNRLLFISNIFGIIQFFIFLSIRFSVKYLSNDPIVICQTKNILIIISVLQYFTGLSYTIEGILQGYQKYRTQSILALLSLSGMLILTHFSKNLQQIWLTGLVVTILKLLIVKIIKI